MDAAEHIGYFTYRCVALNRGDDKWHEVLIRAGAGIETIEAGANSVGVARSADLTKILHLSLFQCGIDNMNRDTFFLLNPELVHTNNDSLFGLDRTLILIGGI